MGFPLPNHGKAVLNPAADPIPSPSESLLIDRVSGPRPRPGAGAVAPVAPVAGTGGSDGAGQRAGPIIAKVDRYHNEGTVFESLCVLVLLV